jgi:hypothetical protein
LCSALTTPADECSQLFEKVAVHNVAVHNPAQDGKGDRVHCDEITTPKSLFLSKGFRQATKFAQKLVTPKVECDVLLHQFLLT